MTMSYARSHYRNTDRSGIREITDPHQVIFVTLRELEKSLRVLCAAKSAGHPYNDRHLTRAFTALYVLQTSLDFERGGDVAESLFRVYEYCRAQVERAFRREPEAALDTATEAIAGLAETWSQIGPKGEEAA